MLHRWLSRDPAGAEPPTLQALQALQADFGREVDEVLRIALEGSPGAWVECREAHGCSEALDQSPQTMGAPWSEVRQVLQALETREEGLWQERPDGWRPWVRARVAEARETYLQAVRPAGGMAQVFANALGSSVQHLSKSAPGSHHTRRCKSCGSPRASDQETHCRYCRQPHYPAP